MTALYNAVMENAYKHHLEVVEPAYARECSEAGRECIAAREAAKLFSIPAATIRTAQRDGRIHPVFELTIGRGVPLYRLSDLVTYFAGRAKPASELLATMRENGVTCFWSVISPGGWLLLCERPGFRTRTWDEAVS